MTDYEKFIKRLGVNTQEAIGAYALIAVSFHRNKDLAATGVVPPKFDPMNVKSDKVKNPKCWASFESLVAKEKGRVLPVVPKKEVGEMLAEIVTAPGFDVKAERIFRPLNAIFGKIPNFDRNFSYEESFTRNLKAVYSAKEDNPPQDFGRHAMLFLALVKWVGLQAGHAAWDRVKFTLNDDALITFLRSLELLGVDMVVGEPVAVQPVAVQPAQPAAPPAAQPVATPPPVAVQTAPAAQPSAEEQAAYLDNLIKSANTLTDDPEKQKAMAAMIIHAAKTSAQLSAPPAQPNVAQTDAQRNADVPYDEILANLTAGDTSQ